MGYSVIISLYHTVYDKCSSYSMLGSEFLPSATAPGLPAISTSITTSNNPPPVGSGTTKALDEILNILPPALVTFIAHLPAVEGISCSSSLVLFHLFIFIIIWVGGVSLLKVVAVVFYYKISIM